MKAAILNVDYDDEGLSVLVKNLDSGKREKLFEKRFEPYFYVISSKEPKVEGAKRVEKSELGWKVFANNPADVPRLREKAREAGEIREYDIPFTQRYLIDKGLKPMQTYDLDFDEKGFKSAKEIEGVVELDAVAFDIETYNPKRMSRSDLDPILMVSQYDGKKGSVRTWKKINKKFVKTSKGEKEMLKKFASEFDADVAYTYNGDNFDLPYIKDRQDKLKVKGLKISVRKGMMQGFKCKLGNSVHIDAYRGMRFLETIGALNLPRLTLEDVYKELAGKEKLDIKISNLWKLWDKGDLEEVAQYSLEDAEAAYLIGEHILPLDTELCKLLGQSLYDVSRMTSSQMVEILLLKKAFARKELAPNRPGEGEVKSRLTGPIKGAYVKTPTPGLHENMAVLDFRGLYPSIIISHNVDPSTLNCKCCKTGFTSPNGHKFCKKKKGTIPEMLGEVVERRAKVKMEMKKASGAKKDDLNNEQTALKIIANSTYGYMLFSRARWFSRECGESVTAWGREYIQKAISEAEKAGFEVLYGDTDSIFLKRGEKTKKEVEEFAKKFNSALPEEMELELEGFYPRGIFVTKREGGAAKKRYAMIRDDGVVEIKGLEFVRRDWSGLAKKTQEKVIRAVLEGDVEKAKKIVEKVIEDLRAGKIELEELVIYTGLKRDIDKYDAVGPHVRAAKRLEEAGEEVGKGSVIGYIVTRGAGNIGARSYPLQLIGKRVPDVEYYTEHQVLPAVMKILNELDVKEDELKLKGKQSDLKKWF